MVTPKICVGSRLEWHPKSLWDAGVYSDLVASFSTLQGKTQLKDFRNTNPWVAHDLPGKTHGKSMCCEWLPPARQWKDTVADRAERWVRGKTWFLGKPSFFLVMLSLWIWYNVYIHTHIYIYIYVCILASIRVYYVYTYKYICIYIYICMYVSIYVHMQYLSM